MTVSFPIKAHYMSRQNSPFRINVGFIIGGQIGVVRDFRFGYETIHLSSDLHLQQLDGLASVSRNPQGLLIQARFQAQTEATCSRCLAPFPLALQWDFIETYVFPQKRKSEEELLVPMDGYIDLGGHVHDYALLAMPSRPLCRPDCKGLCPVCGVNRNHQSCQHQATSHTPTNSPFAALKDLLED